MLQYFPHLVSLSMIMIILGLNIKLAPMIRRVDFECSAVTTLIYFILFFQAITLGLLLINKAEMMKVGEPLTISYLAYEYLNILFHLTISAALNGYLKMALDTETKWKKYRRNR